MPPISDALKTVLTSPVARLFDAAEQTYWPTYAFAAMLAVGFYLVSRRGRKTSVRGLVRYLFPRRILRHASTRLDIKMYLFSSLYLAAQGLLGMSSLAGLADISLHGMQAVFGPGAPDHALPLWAAVIIPVVLYLALELGYWLSHWLLHHVPWLWEFHKVHHSAEVMTPLTEWRQHPVEFFQVPLVMGIVSALVLAPIEWLFGRDLQGAWSPGLILFGFCLTLVHLRHSHVKLNAPGWLGYIIQSPAHHHIHHSTDPRHFDRNLGFCLSVWDWAFGTLCLPQKGEAITLGLFDDDGHKDELVTSTRLVTHLILPVQRLAAKFKPKAATPIIPAE